MEMIFAALVIAVVIVAIMAFTVFKWFKKSLLLKIISLLIVVGSLFALRSTMAALWGIFTLGAGLCYLGAQKAHRK